MRPPIRVAVCTNREAALVAPCLEALGGQVPAEHLAVVTSGLSGAAVEPHRASDATVIAEPLPGLSRARNRALAWAAEGGAEALAFVDDDAEVDAGWHDALARRWEEAPGDVACIGGPIRPLYALPPPSRPSDRGSFPLPPPAPAPAGAG